MKNSLIVKYNLFNIVIQGIIFTLVFLITYIFLQGITYKSNNKLSINSAQAEFGFRITVCAICLILVFIFLSAIEINFKVPNIKTIVSWSLILAIWFSLVTLPIKYEKFPYNFKPELKGDSFRILGLASSEIDSYYPPLYPKFIQFTSFVLQRPVVDVVKLSFVLFIFAMSLVTFILLLVITKNNIEMSFIIIFSFLTFILNLNAPFKSFSVLFLFLFIVFVAKRDSNIKNYIFAFICLFISWLSYSGDIYFSFVGIMIVLLSYFVIPLYRLSALFASLILILITLITDLMSRLTFDQNVFVYIWNQVALPQISGKPNFSDNYFPEKLFFEIGVNKITPILILLLLIGLTIPKEHNFTLDIYIPTFIFIFSILIQRFNISRNMFETSFVNLWPRASYESLFLIFCVFVFANVFQYYREYFGGIIPQLSDLRVRVSVLMIFSLYLIEQYDKKLLYLFSITKPDFF